MKTRPWRLHLLGLSIFAMEAHADYIDVSDPAETVRLGWAIVGAAFLVGVACYGLHRIRRAESRDP